MTVIHLTEYKTRCYGATFQNSGSIKIQIFKDISNIENNIMYIEHLKKF